MAGSVISLQQRNWTVASRLREAAQLLELQGGSPFRVTAYRITVLFSNTARAHELGRTYDWVVVYFYDGDHQEDQCTVVSETRGPLRGRRVVRGREYECGAFYDGESPSPAGSAGRAKM